MASPKDAARALNTTQDKIKDAFDTALGRLRYVQRGSLRVSVDKKVIQRLREKSVSSGCTVDEVVEFLLKGATNVS
jgi:hypothetical protein